MTHTYSSYSMRLVLLEFKSARETTSENSLKSLVLKSVTGFLNTDEGRDILVLGVEAIKVFDYYMITDVNAILSTSTIMNWPTKNFSLGI